MTKKITEEEDRFTEFDSRIDGVNRKGSADEEAKAKQIGEFFLEKVGGFTEIRPADLNDLVPGNGSGYIVGLRDESFISCLGNCFDKFLKSIKCPSTVLSLASKGNRKGWCFLLIPLLANPIKGRNRRRLFGRARWQKIFTAMKKAFPSYYSVTVFGEWKGSKFALPISDTSLMFVFPHSSANDKEMATKFVREHIFDGGKDCDQECFYLSIDGIGVYVYSSAKDEN